MASKTYRRNRISPTTVVTILVLLCAVSAASRLVTPPPRGPIAENKYAAIDKAQTDAFNKLSPKERFDKMSGGHLHPPPSKIKPVPDPNTVSDSTTYFLTHKPGVAGLKQNDKELPELQAAYAKYVKEKAEEDKRNAASASAHNTQPAKDVKSEAH